MTYDPHELIHINALAKLHINDGQKISRTIKYFWNQIIFVHFCFKSRLKISKISVYRAETLVSKSSHRGDLQIEHKTIISVDFDQMLFETFFSRFRDQFHIIISDFIAYVRAGKTSFLGTASQVPLRVRFGTPKFKSRI